MWKAWHGTPTSPLHSWYDTPPPTLNLATPSSAARDDDLTQRDACSTSGKLRGWQRLLLRCTQRLQASVPACRTPICGIISLCVVRLVCSVPCIVPMVQLRLTSQCVTRSALIPDLMATCSTDKTVKLWDTTAGKPVCLATKSMAVVCLQCGVPRPHNPCNPTLLPPPAHQGELFAAHFFPHNPWVLAAGGSEGALAVWEFSV